MSDRWTVGKIAYMLLCLSDETNKHYDPPLDFYSAEKWWHNLDPRDKEDWELNGEAILDKHYPESEQGDLK